MRAWIEQAGYAKAKDLYTSEIDIRDDLPPLVQRLIASGEKNPRIRLRNVDKSRFASEAAIILHLLNDAWSDNWGFVPLTDAEIAYAGKKLKPIIYEDLVRIAELDGEPVAFMLTLPDVNELTADLNGRLFPFGWAKLLWRLRRPRTRAGAGAADGGGEEAPGRAHRRAIGVHADRFDPARVHRAIWRGPRRVRLDPRG